MFNNISIEKARLLQQKQEEIKQKLAQEYMTHSSECVSVTLSLLGNISEISNPQNKSITEIIPTINQANAKARQDYEIKQAQLLKEEMMKLM